MVDRKEFAVVNAVVALSVIKPFTKEACLHSPFIKTLTIAPTAVSDASVVRFVSVSGCGCARYDASMMSFLQILNEWSPSSSQAITNDRFSRSRG